MNETSRMSSQATLRDTPSATSSPESESGATRSGSQAGRMTDLFGQEVAPARPSAQPEKARGLMTLATSGRIGIGSSASAALQLSLASRLKQRLDTAGSTLFSLTWRTRTTPLGRRYLERAASGHRTGGKGFTSWPTPNCPAPHDSQETAGRPRKARESYGLMLQDAAVLASWPSPNTPSGGRSVSTDKMDAKGRTEDGRKHTANLEHAVKFEGWPTCTPRDAKDTGNLENVPVNALLGRTVALVEPIRLTATGLMLTGSSAGMENSGQLNPAHSRWLQGLPACWCWCAPSAKRRRQ